MYFNDENATWFLSGNNGGHKIVMKEMRGFTNIGVTVCFLFCFSHLSESSDQSMRSLKSTANILDCASGREVKDPYIRIAEINWVIYLERTSSR